MLHWRSTAGGTRALPFSPLFEFESAKPAGNILGLISASIDFTRNAEIFAQSDEVDHVYAVASGAVRLSRLMRDGRRQIGAFYLPGDLFGLEAEEHHSFSAESIVESRIKFAHREDFLNVAMSSQELAQQVWNSTAAHLQQAHRHMYILGRSHARERVANFLLDMDTKLDAPDCIDLPMPRRDIADYLGLTIETVSRILTRLEKARIISFLGSRRIVLCNRAALHEMTDS